MPAAKHIHKYRQLVINSTHIERRRVADRPDGTPRYKKFLVKDPKGQIIYKCMLPGCTHHLPARELALGRDSICWVCNQPLTITQEMLNLVKPRHFECRKGNNAPDTLADLARLISKNN